MTLEPLQDKISVQIIDAPAVQSGLLTIPFDNAGTCYALVNAVGPGRYGENGALIPMPALAAGDTIVMHKNDGTEHKHGGETVRFIEPRAILARYHGETAA